MSKRSNKSELGQSLSEVSRSLGATIKSSYELAPGAVGCFLLVVIPGVALVALWSEARQATALILVLAVALLVYFSTKNYGEAALALAAGLFSVYSVDWSTKNFVSFIAIWLVFSVIAFLASSVLIASRVEDIYRQAAVLSAGGDAWKEREKQLRKIAKFKGLGMLSPTAKAEVLRLSILVPAYPRTVDGGGASSDRDCLRSHQGRTDPSGGTDRRRNESSRVHGRNFCPGCSGYSSAHNA